jgi:hypothetical protein
VIGESSQLYLKRPGDSLWLPVSPIIRLASAVPR